MRGKYSMLYLGMGENIIFCGGGREGVGLVSEPINKPLNAYYCIVSKPAVELSQ
jgi:hypothetical protein